MPKCKENKRFNNIKNINERIRSEICNDTINKLKDKNLMDEYKECRSVKNKIKTLENVLENNDINICKRTKIIKDYIMELIPAGTKGVIRGNKFNEIVKETIKNMYLDKKRYVIRFEKRCDLVYTSEIPDWYILEKNTNKVLIGMNQLDLWSGGQQLNRGFKYLIDNVINTEDSKLLCVVCNKIHFRSDKIKVFNLFKVGFTNDTLCYLGNLHNIIEGFFN